jgi:thiamine biosynthesis lipoprotein
MSTAVTLMGAGINDAEADVFFGRIRQLEDVFSRFRSHSELSRFARRELDIDDIDPALRVVLDECTRLRSITAGDFDFEPRRATGNPADPVLDVNALAKGWIIDEASVALRMTADEFLVNAGGDITATAKPSGAPWRVGIQHPTDRSAILGTFEVIKGAIATSGTYERGHHIRTTGADTLLSVTVVGPDLGQADALSTAVYASGQSPPAWWHHIDPVYGLLTMSNDDRLRWLPPTTGHDFEWHFPVSDGDLRLGQQ